MFNISLIVHRKITLTILTNLHLSGRNEGRLNCLRKPQNENRFSTFFLGMMEDLNFEKMSHSFHPTFRIKSTLFAFIIICDLKLYKKKTLE